MKVVGRGDMMRLQKEKNPHVGLLMYFRIVDVLGVKNGKLSFFGAHTTKSRHELGMNKTYFLVVSSHD